jgi:SMI1-KNR4 cell-wall
LAASDPPATDKAISELEKIIGFALSSTYRAFLREFGGGEYGLVTIFSANLGSEFYLGAKIVETNGYLPANLMPFSDDFAGGLYVLKVTNGQAHEPVMYWNEDGGLLPTEFGDVLEFIARYAFGAGPRQT